MKICIRVHRQRVYQSVRVNQCVRIESRRVYKSVYECTQVYQAGSECIIAVVSVDCIQTYENGVKVSQSRLECISKEWQSV